MPVERLDRFQLSLYNNIIARSKKPRVCRHGAFVICGVDELREDLHCYAFEACMTGRCFLLTDTEYAIKPKPMILEHEPDCESVICSKI